MFQLRDYFGLSFLLLALNIVPAELKHAVCRICIRTRCCSSPGVVGELDRCDASILLQADSTALDVDFDTSSPSISPGEVEDALEELY